MNMKRGFDRIAVVLAAIAMILGFALAWWLYSEEAIRERIITLTLLVDDSGVPRVKDLFSNPAFLNFSIRDQKLILEELDPDFEKLTEDEKYKVLDIVSKKAANSSASTGEYLSTSNQYRDIEIRTGEFIYPPDWKCAIAGIGGGIISYLLVFFIFFGIARTCLWVVAGFRDDKSQHD